MKSCAETTTASAGQPGWLNPSIARSWLERSRDEGRQGPHLIASLLGPQDILLDLEAVGRTGLFDAIGRHMELNHALPAAGVVESLAYRERLGSTGLGLGVAIPHARLRELRHIQLAYVRLRRPIPFGAPDGEPVSDVLVLLVPKPATEEHLAILAEATQMFADRAFRERLRRCSTAMAAKLAFDAWPGSPPDPCA